MKKFISISILAAGIFLFIFLKVNALAAEKNIYSLDGDLDNLYGWLHENCEQGLASGNYYIKMLKYNSVLISPSIDFSLLNNKFLQFKARTYGGDGDHSQITVFISVDNGENWQILKEFMPIGSTLEAQELINLSDYHSTTTKIKIETLSATGSKGVGIDDLVLYAFQSNYPPTAVAGDDQNIALGEWAFFDASNSSDSDGLITSYQWDFGDSSIGSGVTTTHLYVSEGIFSVALTVVDDGGASSTDILAVTVGNNYSSSTPPIINPSDIVINEFAAVPGDGEKEWIELFNNASTTLDLSGMIIEDNTGKILELSGEIGAGGFLVAELLTNKLNNAGDIIILKDSDGEIIDDAAYGAGDDGDTSDNAPTAEKGETIARTTDGKDSDNDLSDFALTTTPTRGAANSITPRPTTSGGGGSSQSYSSSQPTADYYWLRQNIIINEIFPNPAGADEDNEFIEIKNIGQSAVDLTNWILRDASDSKYAICSGGECSASIIRPAEFFVVYRNNSKIALNNSGVEQIKLFSPDNILAQTVEYDSTTEENYSYSRDNKGDWYWTASSTPLAENVIITAAVATTSKKNIESDKQESEPSSVLPIIISEILPDPVGTDAEGEFVELYNPNGEAVDLSGWLIDDAEGGSRPYKIKDLVIAPLGYLYLPRLQTRLAFNNDFDSARLFDPSHEIIDEVEYEDASEGLAYALNDAGQWIWTASPTPGVKNAFSAVAEESEGASASQKKSRLVAASVIDTDLESLRDLEVGQKVRTRGVVAVEPGKLGSQIFYLAGSGIQVYSYKKDFPALTVGDLVEVTGELSEAGGERRIKIASAADIRFLEKQECPPPHQMEAAEVGESCEGFLVSISGEVVEVSGNNIYLDDGSDEVRIYINKNTGISTAGIKPGHILTATGIVSETKTGYRVLPRSQEDLKIEGEVKGAAEETGSSGKWSEKEKYLTAILIFLAVISGWQFWQNRQLKKSGWRIVEEGK